MSVVTRATMCSQTAAVVVAADGWQQMQQRTCVVRSLGVHLLAGLESGPESTAEVGRASTLPSVSTVNHLQAMPTRRWTQFHLVPSEKRDIAPPGRTGSSKQAASETNVPSMPVTS
jgi:hypothetical protein